MNGDFSRWTAPNAVARGYAAVLMQQARLQTDSDWNEAIQIQAHRMEAALGDIIGQNGSPKGGNGFLIGAGAGGFTIAAGRYYLDGALIENPTATSYDAQGGDVAVPVLANTVADNSTVIVYVEATRAHVSSQDDSRLADPALGGVDTTTRIRAAWRVAVEEITLTEAERENLIQQARCGHLPAIPGWEATTGGMVAGTIPPGALPDDADCLIPPEAGYLSQENQLYRVQIVRGGTRAQARFIWSRENGSVEALLARNADGEFILQGDRDDAALGFVSGGWVEVYDAADQFFGRTGQLTRLTLTDGIATFVPPVGNFDQLIRPKLRRWDHGGASTLGLQLNLAGTDLERGLRVTFSNGTYAEGDYWLFEARAATGNLVWPPFPMDDPTQPIPPMGWGRRRAPLALARRVGDGLADITELRSKFPSLTCLQAEDIDFDDSNCALDAGTVQEALDALCRRTATGLCSFVASTAAELVAGVAALAPRQSVRICLRGGNFALDAPLAMSDLGHVIVAGTGPHSVVSVRDAEVALLFRNCASVRVIDLSVNGGRTGIDVPFERNGRLGAITAIDCGDVSVERVRGRCRAGLDRAVAVIATRGVARSAQVLVRDCVLNVGQAQIGVNIIGARRAVVENNVIMPVSADLPTVHRRILADPVLVARLVRGVIAFPRTAALLGTVLVRSADGEDRSLPVESFSHARRPVDIPLAAGGDSLSAEILPDTAKRIMTAIRANKANRNSNPVTMRSHLINIMSEAVREGGRARVGRANRRLFRDNLLAPTLATYLTQGIVIAGNGVDEAKVSNNRIERAIDGIRIAASSNADALPPNWTRIRPGNTVARAVVENNSITVQPLSAQTTAFGVFLGHVDNVSVNRNDISAVMGSIGDDLTPHFGVHQFGFRGPRITISENTVTALRFGYAVIPTLANGVSGIWRLRDNATSQVISPYVTGNGVDVI